MTTLPHAASTPLRPAISLNQVSYETYRILQCVFVAVPIVAGLDKYFYLFADWSRYLAPWINHLMRGDAQGFLKLVGLVEIAAGIGVALKPKYFGYVVALWLCGIILNLLSMRMYYDIALRDFGLAVAAIALSRLGHFYDHGLVGGLLRQKT